METRQSARPKTLEDLKEIQTKVGEAREAHSKSAEPSDKLVDAEVFVPFSELPKDQKAELTSLEVAAAQPSVQSTGSSDFLEDPPVFILLAALLLFFFLIKRL